MTSTMLVSTFRNAAMRCDAMYFEKEEVRVGLGWVGRRGEGWWWGRLSMHTD